MLIHTLIIGIGNRLRSDDAIGPIIADIVASWQVAGVKALAVQQLTPELADPIASAERLLFVDATCAPLAGAFAVAPVQPQATRRPLGHHDTPENLLALVHESNGRAPQAWLLAVAAEAFDFGERLTPTAAANVQVALAWLRPWLTAPVAP